MRLVLFEALGEVFGVDVMAVREVVRVAARRSLASAVPWVAGVADTHAGLLPVVDVGVRVGRGGRGIFGDLIVLEAGGRSAALAVDRVLGMDDADVVPAPAGTTDAAAGIAVAGERLVLVLDPRALLPPGADESSVLVAAGPWTPVLTAEVHARGVREVVLREENGWDGADVDFLADLPELRCVRISHRAIRNVTGIHAQPALRELEVHTRCRTPIDASAFPALERCALRGRPRARSVLSAERLVELEVTHYAGADLRAFGGLRSLQTLTLERGVLETLDGIEALTSLRVLRLRGLRRLRSLDGVERLPALAELDVAECPAVSGEAARR